MSLYIHGHGPRDAEVMLIGERPGGDEAKQGRPFVGKSGKELDRYLLEGGIHREDVYVTNLCKSYSPSNDDPTPEEIKQDEHLLIEELKTVRPKYLGLVGRFAARWFLGDDFDMEALHGLPYHGRTRSTMALYHPAFALHSPHMSPIVWNDFIQFTRMVKGELDGEVAHFDDAFPEPKYRLLEYPAEAPDLDPDLPIYIDTEGSVEHPWGLSWTQCPGRGFVLLKSNTVMLQVLNGFIHKYDLLVVLHNAFHDIAVLRAMGIEGFRFRDTMVRSYHTCLLPQGLKPLSRRLVGVQQQDYWDVVGTADKEKKIQWLCEVHQWVSNRWPDVSKTPSSPRIRKASGKRSRKISPKSAARSSVSSAL